VSGPLRVFLRKEFVFVLLTCSFFSGLVCNLGGAFVLTGVCPLLVFPTVIIRDTHDRKVKSVSVSRLVFFLLMFGKKKLTHEQKRKKEEKKSRFNHLKEKHSISDQSKVSYQSTDWKESTCL